MLSRRSIILALTGLLALSVGALAQSAEAIQRRVMATTVHPVEKYMEYVQKSGIGQKSVEAMRSKFQSLDIAHRTYFAYIVNDIIDTMPFPERKHGSKLVIFAEMLGKRPSTAGDVETIKDFVEVFPLSKGRFINLVDLPEYKTAGANTPLGAIGLWLGLQGGRKNRNLF